MGYKKNIFALMAGLMTLAACSAPFPFFRQARQKPPQAQKKPPQAREKPPAGAWEVSGDYDVVSDCVFRTVQREYKLGAFRFEDYEKSTDPEKRTARITARRGPLDIAFWTIPARQKWDLSFEETNGDRTRVALRTKRGLFGRPGSAKALDRIVAACGQSPGRDPVPVK